MASKFRAFAKQRMLVKHVFDKIGHQPQLPILRGSKGHIKEDGFILSFGLFVEIWYSLDICSIQIHQFLDFLGQRRVSVNFLDKLVVVGRVVEILIK